MTNAKKPFYIDVVCPVCGVIWAKPIYGDYQNGDEALMKFLSKPTCCGSKCREQIREKRYCGHWNVTPGESEE